MKRREEPTAALERRLAALARAADLADGRMDAADVEAARAVAGRAGQRVGLGLGATVVALAGPTGAGKSSLFNALAGQELVNAGVRRPTTSTATAAVWGDPPSALLDWLDVPRRHVLDGEPDGLVLLDLPDFDSVAAAHRAEVDRLIEVVDLLVWVVDPQKYADASLHDGYLRPLAGHRDVMLVALNQADRLFDDELRACRRNLGELLSSEGLDGVDVHPVSALGGTGVAELRALLGRRVQDRAAALQRLSADVTRAAEPLARGCDDRSDGQVSKAARQQLVAALSEASGVPATVAAVEGAHRRRGALETGWPLTRWVRRLRPDPLKRLRLGGEPGGLDRTSLPKPTAAQRMQVDGAVRALAAESGRDLPAPWPGLVRSAATRSEAQVGDRLDRALASTDLRMSHPRWWTAAKQLQRLFVLVVLAGLVWLAAVAAIDFLHLDDAVPLPELEGLPIPTLLLIGGLLAGILCALLFRAINRASARRRARRARRELQAGVESAADELIIVPVEAELTARRELCEAVRAAT